MKKYHGSGEPLGSIVFDLTGPIIEPQISRSKHDRLTACLLARNVAFVYNENNISVSGGSNNTVHGYEVKKA